VIKKGVYAMITRKMQKFLEEIEKNPQLMKQIKTCVYMNRIQKRLERELDSTLWLAVHYPKVLLDEEKEYQDASGKIVCHRRLKKLLLIVKALNPKMEVELVLRNLEFPEQEQPMGEISELYEMKGKCQKCGLAKDLCTCKEIEKEQKRTTEMPRPN
jgi:hypothetical protein